MSTFFSLFIEHSQKYWYTVWSFTALPQHGKNLEFNTYLFISQPPHIFRRCYFLPLLLLIFLVTYNSEILHAHWFWSFKFVSLWVFSLIIFLVNMSLSSNTSSHSNGKNWYRYLCRVFIYYSNTFVAWSSSSLFLISSMTLSVFHDPIGVFPLIWKKSPTVALLLLVDLVPFLVFFPDLSEILEVFFSQFSRNASAELVWNLDLFLQQASSISEVSFLRWLMMVLPLVLL